MKPCPDRDRTSEMLALALSDSDLTPRTRRILWLFLVVSLILINVVIATALIASAYAL